MHKVLQILQDKVLCCQISARAELKLHDLMTHTGSVTTQKTYSFNMSMHAQTEMISYGYLRIYIVAMHIVT